MQHSRTIEMAKIDHMKFAAWAGLGGTRPSDSEIADYVRDYIDNLAGELTEPDASAIRECADALDAANAKIDALKEERDNLWLRIGQLENLLKECADDLAPPRHDAEIRARHGNCAPISREADG